jgi:hypothetical protein
MRTMVIISAQERTTVESTDFRLYHPTIPDQTPLGDVRILRDATGKGLGECREELWADG